MSTPAPTSTADAHAGAPLSPGRAGRVFNPLVRAEVRRWMARPVQYLGIVAITLAGIVLLYWQNDYVTLAFTWLFGGGPLASYLRQLTLLIARPSTIVPLLMVWRALVSFRDGGLYKPFHTTFLTPGEFLWGIIAVPFLVGFVILVLYVGAVLMPDQIEGIYATPPDFRGVGWYAIPLRIFLILFEGAANAGVICFLALYLGLRGGATLAALFPVLVCVVALQAAHALFFMYEAELHAHLVQAYLRHWLPNEMLHSPGVRESLRALLPALPKLAACVVLWMLTTWHLRLRDYE